MGTSAIQFVSLVFVTWLSGYVLHWLVRKDPLDKIPGPPAESWIAGSFMKIMDNTGGWEYHEKLTRQFGKVFRFKGLFGSNVLYVYDTKAFNHILVKDQYQYEETEEYVITAHLVMGDSILSSSGAHHKKQRKMLNPVFSVTNLKEITPAFYSVAHKLRNSLLQQVSGGQTEVEVLGWMTRTALELMGQGAFGYSFDSLDHKAPEHPFAKSLKNLLPTLNDPALLTARFLLGRHVYTGSPGFRRWVVNTLPWKRLHELRDMVDVLHETSVKILSTTKKALAEGTSEKTGNGKDIMTLLVKANNSASEDERLTEDEVLAQISALTFAAMDTTSNTMGRVLHLLSEHPDIQDRLREEVVAAVADAGGDLSYEALSALPLMDAVVRETLRMYSPFPFLWRQAMQDMVLPVNNPIDTLDGKTTSEVFVPKGTKILLQLYHCNRDPDIWGPDAAEWKPDRWLAPLPGSVAEAKVPGVYSNMMSFMGGGRACIGYKFSQLEMKVVVGTLIQSLKFSPAKDKKIFWQMNAVLQPTIEGAELTSLGGSKLQLPLHVTPL